MTKVYLGLGSNFGYKLKNLKSAVKFFNWDERFNNVRLSPLYLTTPYGNKDQDNFINCVVSFSTELSVDALFNVMLELERKIGRAHV